MLICLDVGNSHIFGGIFCAGRLSLCFRHPTSPHLTADQIGIFLRNILSVNQLDYRELHYLAICSVVPSVDHSIKAACKKYFQIDPFVLDSNSALNTGLTIMTEKPDENGADILAGVIAASYRYPGRDLLVLDLGTVTTISVVTSNKVYLGTTFIPGVCMAMDSFGAAAKLSPVAITAPSQALGRSTSNSMQAGIYFGHLGAMREIVGRIVRELAFAQPPLLIATGGFAKLFEQEKLFDHIDPELVLYGVKIAYEKKPS